MNNRRFQDIHYYVLQVRQWGPEFTKLNGTPAGIHLFKANNGKAPGRLGVCIVNFK